MDIKKSWVREDYEKLRERGTGDGVLYTI